MNLSKDKTNHNYFQKAVRASLGSEYTKSHNSISQSYYINSFGNDFFKFLFVLNQSAAAHQLFHVLVGVAVLLLF